HVAEIGVLQGEADRLPGVLAAGGAIVREDLDVRGVGERAVAADGNVDGEVVAVRTDLERCAEAVVNRGDAAAAAARQLRGGKGHGRAGGVLANGAGDADDVAVL